jgi:mannosyl-oligosaccharide alpha-1,2-mannosidase
MVPESEESADILFLGAALVDETSGKVAHIAEMEHRACSAGGTFALAGRLLSRPEDVEIGERLARGCAWAHVATPSGLMPEKAQLLRCPSVDIPCAWDEERWLQRQAPADSSPRPQSAERLPRGFWRIDNPRHLLRPEAAESLFVLYRVTGKTDLQDIAWDMFRAVERAAATSSGDAFAALADVTWSAEDGAAEHLDEMDVFFLGQTLKYFYLIFSDPGFVSLDDWVFNTEAHPFRRPVPA